ncbi:MAG: SusC/RagA family TonB-linked outer membrane protein, partial [Bacteroidales bacterium]|nr:SusC/RagA family TonB-linked outer membrane protein [Bacteroidales bacterium]
MCNLLTLHATVFSQSIVTMKGENISLKKALVQLEQETQVKFVYRDEAISDFKVSFDLKNSTIEESLNILLKGTGTTFHPLENNLIVISSVELIQGIPVTGVITDANGDPLPGVNIIIKGTTTGVVSDANGKYSINVPNRDAVLQFSFVGYATQDIAVGDQQNIEVSLSEGAEMEEVVVIGYGTVRKSDLTGAVASISSEKVTQVNAVSNVAQALQGQIPGVQANQRSGQPGESIIIKIRGTNSIGASNDPLYVVDGMSLESLSGQLNPDDIQSIEILKDASATAIYGSRGANGVIMITTKRGSEGKAKVSYSGYFGVQQLRKKIELTNATEFATLQNEVAANDGDPLPWTTSQIAELGEGTDWQKEVYRSGKVQNHDVSVSGGTANTKYYASFGYFNQDGIIPNSGYDRISFRVNFDQKITRKLDMATSLSIQNAKYSQAVYTGADGGGGIPFTTMVIPATQGIYNDDGTYTRFTGVSWGQTNPVGILKELYNPNNDLRIIGNVKLAYEIIDGLRLRLSAGVDNTNNRVDYYANSSLTLGQASQGNGNAYKNYSNAMTFLNENLLTYNKSFGEHNLDALAGITYQYNESEYLNSGRGVGFINDIFQNNNLGAATVKAQPTTG